jgi:putative iron-dependent peroxidase
MMKRAPILSDQLSDIQGMLNSGFGWLTVSRFWLLTIRDGHEDQARAWLAKLARSNLMVSAERVRDRKKKGQAPIREAVAVAFSFAGLAKLGLKETSRHPFPTPFRSGMGSALRESLLRDIPRQQWRWSDVEQCEGRQTVHVVVANWRLPDEKSQMAEPDPDSFCTVTTVENRPGSFRDGKLFEPFGFRDGIAQPVIRGLREEDGDNPKRVREEAGPLYDDRVISAGEFVVGYRNEYDELTYCPDLEDWTESGRATHPGGGFTLNGSYLAVRQIEQDVAAFKALEAATGEETCAKLMGRSKNGLPLSWTGDPKEKVSDSRADTFRYQVEDANGFMCPKGAHIRRMNPRDSLGVDVKSGIKSSKLHRLLRRGRPYLEETEDKNNPKHGLFFIACNADLERQFELIHQRWMRNFRFGNLHHEDDPVVGSPELLKTFTVPGLPSGAEVSMAALTRTLGGGYFFLPGLNALQFIVEHGARPTAPVSPQPAAPPPAQLAPS